MNLIVVVAKIGIIFNTIQVFLVFFLLLCDFWVICFDGMDCFSNFAVIHCGPQRRPSSQ